MSRVQIYEGSFMNTETTRPGNVNIQQLCKLKIYDNEFHLAGGDSSASSSNVVFNHNPIFFSNTITVDFYIGFFVVGRTYNITGSASNNITITVSAILSSTSIAVDETLTDETVSLSTVTFTDTDPGLPAPEVIELEMTDTPGVISVIDNEEDAFTPVRSKQLEIGIYSGNGIDISSFADGGDQKWYVEYLVNDIMKFIGFLSISDLDQAFMPDPNVINLTATDGLGFLSDIPLTDFDLVNPTNERKIMDFIAWMLSKTGLELNIVVCMNIRERFATPLVSDDTGDGHFYKWCSLDAKTFEDEIGVSEDCRTGLEKIFGEMCTVSQDNGTWFIMRKDEMDFGRPYYLFKFDFEGTFIEATEENFEKNIGVDLPLSWMEDALVLLERKYRLLKLTYNYITPEEIICNIDFARGTVISEPDYSLADSTGTYEVDCWTLRRLFSQPVLSTAYITRKFVYGTEEQRYLTITPKPDTATPNDFLASEDLDVQQGDKITVSVDFRYDTDYGGGGNTVRPIRIYLEGEDGNWYYWWHSTSSDINEFFWTNAGTSEQERSIPVTWDASAIDETQWQTLSVSLAALPVSGKLYIGLNQGHQVATGGTDQNINFQNLTLTLHPYINGSYRLFTGQEHLAEQFLNTVAVREKEIFITDSPRKAFKGAILKADGADFVLANEFYDASLFPNADFTDDDIRPFGELQLFDVWNQINRLMRRFDGVIDGLESNGDMPDLKYKYFLTDSTENTDNKMFMLLHFEQEQHLCEQTSFLTEVADSTIDKIFTGNTFKYITSGE